MTDTGPLRATTLDEFAVSEGTDGTDALDEAESIDDMREVVRELRDEFETIVSTQAEFNDSVMELCETVVKADHAVSPGDTSPDQRTDNQLEGVRPSRGFY